MKKSLIFLMSLFLLISKIQSQSVAVNTTGSVADASSILDVSSTGKGMLIPRMTTAQRTAIASPATGLMVYDNTLAQFYYYNGTAWTAIAFGANANNYWTLSGSNLYNNSGTSVGIGLTTPSANLDIAGTNAGTNSLQLRSGNTSASTSSNQILFGFNNTTNYRHVIKTRHNSGSATNNAIDFYTWNFGIDAIGTIGTKHIMTLDGNGFVGIGYTAPSTALDVNGKTRTTTFQMTTGATTGYVLHSDATGNATWVNPNTLITETDPQVSSSVSNFIPKWNGTALTDGIMYDNGSNIGIGTSSPTHKLQVQGTGLLQSAFISTGSTANIIAASASGAESANYNSTYAGGSVFKRWAYGKNDDAESGSNAGSDFFINRYDDNGNYLNRVMNIKRSNGYVCIGGNFAPDEQLHVIGKTKTTDFQMTNGAIIGYVLQSDATGNATWVNPNTLTVAETDPQVTSSTNNMLSKWNGASLTDGIIYDNGTSIGIGTTTPGAKLHISAAGANINVDATSGSATINANSASAQEASITLKTNNNLRWSFGKNTTAESGSNNGGDFFINRYTDAGAYIGQPLAINRANGTVTMGNDGASTTENTLRVNGSISAAVTTQSGNYTLDGRDYCAVFTGATGTFTLPSASACIGRIYLLINQGTGSLTTSIAYRTGSGSTSTSVAAGTNVQIISDGAEWRKIN